MSRDPDSLLITRAPHYEKNKPRQYLGYTFLVFNSVVIIILLASFVLIIIGAVLYAKDLGSLLAKRLLASGIIIAALMFTFMGCRFFIR
ncbi:MAG: hypothetical protein ACTSYW_06850 [Candidatus Heimdallarchaeota archaeon]